MYESCLAPFYVVCCLNLPVILLHLYLFLRISLKVVCFYQDESAMLLEELSKATSPKEMQLGAVGQVVGDVSYLSWVRVRRGKEYHVELWDGMGFAVELMSAMLAF